MIHAQYAWERGLTGEGATIALLDTGVLLDYDDFAGLLVENTADPDDGIDNDHNGYVDDRLGYDFVENDGVPQDEDSHGSALSAIIGADGNSGTALIGIAQDARIIPIKMLTLVGKPC